MRKQNNFLVQGYEKLFIEMLYAVVRVYRQLEGTEIHYNVAKIIVFTL